MMTAESDLVKVLEQCHVSPPPNSVPATYLPLTFLDVDWLGLPHTQAAIFYKIPFSVAKFTEEILPLLNNSLSLALQLFFPLSGNLVTPPQPEEPYILYKDGDFVPVFVAQSTGVFDDFLGQEARDAKEVRLLLPPIPSTHNSDDTLMGIAPLLAIKITLFPNSGICIGMTYRHVVADGMSFYHFVRTWASICKAKCDMSNVSISLPIHDKSYIKDPDGIKNIKLKKWRAMGSPIWQDNASLPEDCVRATFTLPRSKIDRLKEWVTTKLYSGRDTTPELHLSSYVVICAFLWDCTIKTLNLMNSKPPKDGEQCHFAVVADSRNRYNSGVPAAFFGNCIHAKLVPVARSKFSEEDSITVAAEAISQCVQSFKDTLLIEDPNKPSQWEQAFGKGETVLTLSGSPKIAVYDIDFGWGRPSKFVAGHIDISGSISLYESGNEKRGIEFGLCRSRHEMEVFTSVFLTGLKKFV